MEHNTEHKQTKSPVNKAEESRVDRWSRDRKEGVEVETFAEAQKFKEYGQRVFPRQRVESEWQLRR